MHAVLIQALYPPLSLLDCLLWWAAIAAHFWLAHMGGVVVRGRPAIKIPARVLDYGPNNKMAQFSVSIDHRCNLFLMSNVDFFLANRVESRDTLWPDEKTINLIVTLRVGIGITLVKIISRSIRLFAMSNAFIAELDFIRLQAASGRRSRGSWVFLSVLE